MQYADTTGTVVRSEDYWRWMIGRKYAHVIWVACQGETVRGYAFVKDHKILELASPPGASRRRCGPCSAGSAPRPWSGPIPRSSSTPRSTTRCSTRSASPPGKVIDQEEYDGTASMYHIPNVGRFLDAILPELARRAAESGTTLPLELGLTVGDRRWLLHVEGRNSRVEPDKLSRRHLTLSPSALVRLAMGHTGHRSRDGRGRGRVVDRRRRSTPPASSSPSARSGAARSTPRPPERRPCRPSADAGRSRATGPAAGTSLAFGRRSRSRSRQMAADRAARRQTIPRWIRVPLNFGRSGLTEGDAR